MKRLGIIAGLALTLSGGAAGGAAVATADTCEGGECGRPSCSVETLRLRPERTRKFSVYCSRSTGARVKTPPAGSDITNLVAGHSYMEFDVRPRDGAPRHDSVVFEVEGAYETIDHTIALETIPISENAPPHCYGGSHAKRSDGRGPVDLWVSFWCQDPDGDAAVVEGGGPGTHLGLPESPRAGTGHGGGTYRTKTYSGSETTYVWATDELGARSDSARIDVAVGPSIDSPPECHTGGAEIYSRPGATRRFGVFCNDHEGDEYVATISDQPDRGAIPLFVPVENSVNADGRYQAIDATYQPTGDSLEPDPFAVTAKGVRGDGPSTRVQIVPQPYTENWGGYCGWGDVWTTAGVPGAASLNCEDQHGDALSAEILTEPKNGTAAAPVVTPDRFGRTQITVPYVPDPGFTGYDCVKVKVSDGHGFEQTVVIDVQVVDRPPSYDGPWNYPPPPMPSWPTGGPLPPVPPGQPLTRSAIRSAARTSLGSGAIKRVRRIAGAEVWARTKLSRRALLRDGQAPGMAVICLSRCRIRSDATLTVGGGGLRASRRKAVAAKTSGQVEVVSLALDPRGRKALRRGRKVRAKFGLTVRAAGAKAGPLRRTIRIVR